MRFLLITTLLLVGIPAQAFVASLLEPTQPFEPIIVEDATEELGHVYLGTLMRYPDMLEFTLEESAPLAISLLQRPAESPLPLGVILVQVNEDGRGVTEIARAHQQSVSWNDMMISELGKTLTVSEPLELTLEPGLYRLEVSTPSNDAVYGLSLTEPASAGYFTTVGSVYTTLRHFGYSPLAVVGSPYVYYPLGSLVVVVGIFLTWRYRQRLFHAA